MRTFEKSEAYLERAERTIPLGSQTFSKSRTQFPHGVSPYFITHANGSRAWDLDGNEYIDFINGLCAINLGHNDPDVNAAVRAQLDDGVIFSLPHPIETEVAEQIVKMVPCAEKVRFGKNGSDATSGAVRIARAHTGRDHVAVCGYHGWQDWYIGSTARNRGVPQATRDLTHGFAYNDLDSLRSILRAYDGNVAAVVIEPMNVAFPAPGFLEELRAMTHAAGAVLVFDETITGFRYANGGAQELFGVTPDLATFGKGMANGYAVSAVAGRADLMKLMEEVFFSFTFGGETLSLAAALATMRKMEREPVVERLRTQGQKIIDALSGIIRDADAGAFLSVAGHPSWSFLLISDAAPYSSFDLKTLFMQECMASGILAYGTHNMSYAHSDADIETLLQTYRRVVPLMAEVVRDRSLTSKLRGKPLEPLFKVR